MKLDHFLGGTLLVSGTTIGAGILALPVITGFIGFIPALCVFFVCWGMMLASAFFFLDVNLSLKGEPNFISMARATLGRPAAWLNWIFYLLLLYSLLAAYIAGSAPLFQMGAERFLHYQLPQWGSYFCLPVLFAAFVYLGTGGVDLINRILMIGLGLAYAVIIGALPGHVDGRLLTHVDWSLTPLVTLVVMTSFGYHIIIPSLTTYMSHDRTHLRWTLFIGSLIPLLAYLLWEVLTLGVVPLSLLEGAWQRGEGVSGVLAHLLQKPWISVAVHCFAFFTIVTSFLGVSLSLADFLTDGLKIKKSWEGRLLAMGLVFIPPLVFLFSYERGFMLALEYAGGLVAILLVIFPAMMAWTLKMPLYYRTLPGRALLIVVMIFGLLVVGAEVMVRTGHFNSFLENYVSH
ncbi:MAG: tyrosine transporter [Simkaniaceae bacterium]|nr:tyrosine transporter [Simkaniaceae bacterium]